MQLKLKQGRPHVFLDMRIVDDQGQELPWDGKAFGNLQASRAAAQRHACPLCLHVFLLLGHAGLNRPTSNRPCVRQRQAAAERGRLPTSSS